MTIRLMSILAVLASGLFLTACQDEASDDSSGAATEESSGDTGSTEESSGDTGSTESQ